MFGVREKIGFLQGEKAEGKTYMLERVDIESGEVVEISRVVTSDSPTAGGSDESTPDRLFLDSNFLFKIEEFGHHSETSGRSSQVFKMAVSSQAFKDTQTYSEEEESVKFSNHMFFKFNSRTNNQISYFC